MADEAEEQPAHEAAASGSNAWTDLGLTLPIFVVYHLGVVLLPMRNAADPVTQRLKDLADHNLVAYAALTLAIGLGFVLLLSALGKGHAIEINKFVVVGIEGVAYAVAMRFVGGAALEALPLSASSGGDALSSGPFAGLIMSLGAGFYEEAIFRVALFGSGAWVIKTMEGWGPTGLGLLLGWALVCALAFSGWHHLGPGADAFDARVFVYRAVCGLVLTAIYFFRGFAPAVWTHALYDVWAMS